MITRTFKIELPNGQEHVLMAKANVVNCREGDGSIPGGINRFKAVEDITIPEAEQKEIIKAILDSLENHDHWTEQ